MKKVGEANIQKVISKIIQISKENGYWPSRSDWDEFARKNKFPSVQTITNYTGKNWDSLRKEYGFQPKIKKFSQEECITALKEASKEYGLKITMRQYKEWQNKNPDYPTIAQITMAFGTFSKAKLESGLIPNAIIGFKYTDKELINILRECEKYYGRFFTEEEYEKWRIKNGKKAPSIETIRKRFGSIVQLKKKLGLEFREDYYYNREKFKNKTWEAYLFHFIRESLLKEKYDQWAKQNNAPSSEYIKKYAGGYRKALSKIIPLYLDELQ